MAESLGTFGEVGEEELGELDLEPIPFSLVGYTRKKDPKTKKHAPVEHVFHVHAASSFGPVLSALLQVDANGQIPVQAGVQFIAGVLLNDEKERWHSTLADPDTFFDASMIGAIAEKLAERYGMRPTAPRSARRAGSRQTGRTTTAGRGGRALPSPTSTRRTRSTSSTR